MVNFHPVSCATMQQGDRPPKLSQSSIGFCTVPRSSRVKSNSHQDTTGVFRERVLEFRLFNRKCYTHYNSLRRPLDRLLLLPEKNVRLVESEERGHLQMSILMSCQFAFTITHRQLHYLVRLTCSKNAPALYAMCHLIKQLAACEIRF